MNKKFKISLVLIISFCLLITGSISLIHANTSDVIKVNAPIINSNNPEAISEIKNTNKNNLKYDSELSSKLGINIFSDKANNEYFFNDKKDSVIGFVKNDINQDNNIMLNEEDVKKLSNTYLSEIVDANNYKFTNLSYSDSTKTYSIVYYYYIDKYKTSDMVYLSIDNMGELVSFSAPNVGIFNDVNIPSFVENDIYSCVSLKLKNTYGKLFNLYNINDIIINKDDDGIYLNVDVSYGTTKQNIIEDFIPVYFNEL